MHDRKVAEGTNCFQWKWQSFFTCYMHTKGLGATDFLHIDLRVVNPGSSAARGGKPISSEDYLSFTSSSVSATR
jgi:hypothetical protein